MKIIITIIITLGFQYISLAQNTIQQPLKAGAKHKKVGYIASAKEPGSVAKFTPSQQNREIVITSLPATNLALTSVNIELDMLGSFTIKGASSLKIPYNCEVFIEDKLTGKMFNLKDSEVYTFKVDQHMENRFFMHILDKTSPGQLVSSGIIRTGKFQS